MCPSSLLTAQFHLSACYHLPELWSSLFLWCFLKWVIPFTSSLCPKSFQLTIIEPLFAVPGYAPNEWLHSLATPPYQCYYVDYVFLAQATSRKVFEAAVGSILLFQWAEPSVLRWPRNSGIVCDPSEEGRRVNTLYRRRMSSFSIKILWEKVCKYMKFCFILKFCVLEYITSFIT